MYKRISLPFSNPDSFSIINPTYYTDITVAVTPPSPPSIQPQPQLLTKTNDYYNQPNYKDASKYFYNGFYNDARRAIIGTDQAEAARLIAKTYVTEDALDEAEKAEDARSKRSTILAASVRTIAKKITTENAAGAAEGAREEQQQDQ